MLPFDLLNLILSYLPTSKFFDVCQNPICLDRRIWANRLYQDFGIVTSGDPYDDYIDLIQAQTQQQQYQLNFDKERVAQQMRKNCDVEINRVRQNYTRQAEAALDLVNKIDDNKVIRMLQTKRVPELAILITTPALKLDNLDYRQRNRKVEQIMYNLGVSGNVVNYYPELTALLVKMDNKADYNLVLNRVLSNKHKYKNVNVLYNY